jgi:exodeoxyribonuclease VII large subunit
MSPEEEQSPVILSVSALNRRGKKLLEEAFPSVWVTGEISNLATPASGHWYFTLKDDNAQVRCAVFRNVNFRARFKPRNGDQVVIRGKLSLYENRGEYQLIGQHLEAAGDGALQRAFEELKARLAAEGLFDQDRKKEIPAHPRHIAVITSPGGAAIHDILTVFRRRHASTQITVIPSLVQGKDAAQQLCAAVELANRQAKTLEPPIDTLLISRGGGSLEDLWSFNDEQLARAIVASDLPVVSAVGHETDFTISDLAADLRAPTPSAAAELLSPDSGELLLQLDRLRKRLARAIRQQVQLLSQQAQWLAKQLRHPGSRLQEQSQRLDELDLRLQRASNQLIGNARANWQFRHSRLLAATPKQLANQLQQRNFNLQQRLYRAIIQCLDNAGSTLQARSELLHSVSPLNTLQRGYAVVSTASGEMVRSSKQVGTGQEVTARLAEGRLKCRVEKVLD